MKDLPVGTRRDEGSPSKYEHQIEMEDLSVGTEEMKELPVSTKTKKREEGTHRRNKRDKGHPRRKR